MDCQWHGKYCDINAEKNEAYTYRIECLTRSQIGQFHILSFVCPEFHVQYKEISDFLESRFAPFYGV
jgi:hypothetical protein